MAQNTTYTQAIRIITQAMENAGLLQEGDEPNSEQVAKYMNRLNDLVNAWQTQGIKLWTWLDLTVPLVAGQGLYRIGPGLDVSMTKPLRVIEAYYLNTESNNPVKTPLICLSWDEYTRLSQTTQQGAINSYFVNKLQTELDVRLWLVPDATSASSGDVHLIIQQQITNIEGATGSMNFPREWFMALCWGLADEISTGQSDRIMNRCAEKANIYRSALENWDVEDAMTFFVPDQRSAYSAISFQ